MTIHQSPCVVVYTSSPADVAEIIDRVAPLSRRWREGSSAVFEHSQAICQSYLSALGAGQDGFLEHVAESVAVDVARGLIDYLGVDRRMSPSRHETVLHMQAEVIK